MLRTDISHAPISFGRDVAAERSVALLPDQCLAHKVLDLFPVDDILVVEIDVLDVVCATPAGGDRIATYLHLIEEAASLARMMEVFIRVIFHRGVDVEYNVGHCGNPLRLFTGAYYHIRRAMQMIFTLVGLNADDRADAY